MDLLDRLLRHDAWTTRLLLERSRELDEDQLAREFDIGHRTVGATLRHIVDNVEIWSALMAGRAVRDDPMRLSGDGWIAEMITRLDGAAGDLAVMARDVADRGGWDELWLDRLDDPPAEKSYGGAIAHVITHGMHHRAQVLYMLKRLGLQDLPEGDVLSWEAGRVPDSAR